MASDDAALKALEETVSQWPKESIPLMYQEPRFRLPLLKTALHACANTTVAPEEKLKQLMTQFSENCERFTNSFTAEQKKKIEQMYPTVEKVWAANRSAQGLTLEPALKAMLTTSWLNARDWNVEAAKKMCEDHIQWRKEYKIDETPFWPPPEQLLAGYDNDSLAQVYSGPTGERPEYWTKVLTEIHKVYSDGWHKWDKQGRPIFIERSGASNPKLMVRYMQASLNGNPNVPEGSDWSDIIMQMHFVSNNLGGLLCAHNTLARGELVNNITVVMDMDGLGLGHLYAPAMKLMEKRDRLDQGNFPDCLNRVYVVHAPAMMKIAWNVVKVWLDKKVQEKVIFLGKDWKEVLRDAISPENLPKFLGGECECRGVGCDCILPPTGEDPITKDTPGVKVLKVGAGKKDKITQKVQKGEMFTWEFSSKPVDIGYSAVFHAVGSKKEQTVTGKQRPNVAVISDSFAAPEDGEIVIKFDNSFSWMTGKEICYKVEQSVAVSKTLVGVTTTSLEADG